MPIGPDDWAALATAIGTGLGGVWGGIKYQQKASGKPSGKPDEDSVILVAIEQLGGRVDGVGRQVNGVRLTVEGLIEDVQRHSHEIARLKRAGGGEERRAE